MRFTRSSSGSTSALAPSRSSESVDLQWVEQLTRLLDAQFRIPGTNVRFGADFLLGLVPGAGDLVSMAFSGLLISTMAKHGASGRLIGRMLTNVLLDTLVGSVPILGNVFDLFYKANVRNLKLMKEHYHEGKHAGSAWPVVLIIMLVLALAFVTVSFLLVLFFRFLWELTATT